MEQLMQIGEAARLTGVAVRTVHYYEGRGLLEPAASWTLAIQKRKG